MKSYWENYKGKQIFYAHYDHLPLEEYRAEVVEVEKEMLKQPKNSVLLLVDTNGILITPEVFNLAKDTAMHSQPYLKKTAILGMGGVRKSLLEIVSKFTSMNIAAFDTENDAKEFLIQE